MLGNRALVTLAVVALTLAGCSRRQQPTPPTTTQTQTQTPTPPRTTTPDAPPPTRPDPGAETRRVREELMEMVFFDYDQSAIRGDARPVLDRKVAILRANPNVALRIEGHADERGSVEYNLALSLRRANAIRDYLANFNLDGARFDVAPIGEERPLSSGASEDAYARNRRGEFHITRGGDNLVAPR
ncbi:MAG: OmpA family protein [Longimicrobiales bacterium]